MHGFLMRGRKVNLNAKGDAKDRSPPANFNIIYFSLKIKLKQKTNKNKNAASPKARSRYPLHGLLGNLFLGVLTVVRSNLGGRNNTTHHKNTVTMQELISNRLLKIKRFRAHTPRAWVVPDKELPCPNFLAY